MLVKPPFELVAVVWDDASTDHGWQHVDDDDTERNLVITVGFLTREDEHYLYLASTCDESRNTNARIKIPLGMVAERSSVQFTQRRGTSRRSRNAKQADESEGTAQSS